MCFVNDERYGLTCVEKEKKGLSKWRSLSCSWESRLTMKRIIEVVSTQELRSGSNSEAEEEHSDLWKRLD